MNGGSVVSFMFLTYLSRNKEMAVAAVPLRLDTLLKNFCLKCIKKCGLVFNVNGSNK